MKQQNNYWDMPLDQIRKKFFHKHARKSCYLMGRWLSDKQRANAEYVLTHWAEIFKIPMGNRSYFNMADYGIPEDSNDHKTDCNTPCCFAGWLSLSENFLNEADVEQEPEMDAGDVLLELFGKNSIWLQLAHWENDDLKKAWERFCYFYANDGIAVASEDIRNHCDYQTDILINATPYAQEQANA